MLTRSRSKQSTNATFTINDRKEKKRKIKMISKSILCNHKNRADKSKIRKNELSRKSIKDKINELLSIDVTSDIICRDKEIALTRNYFLDIINNHENKLLYVVGCPGTGKTAVIKNIIKEFDKKIKYFFLNCMNVPNPIETIRCLNDKLSGMPSKRPNKNIISDLSQFKSLVYKIQQKHRIVIICDEIDRIMNVAEDILYPLVDLLFQSNLDFSLIMISNSLDFNSRIFPRLQHQPNSSGTYKRLILVDSISSINFNAYSYLQIGAILRNRLESCLNYFEPSAIEYCAKKVGAVGGDIRKALAIMKAAVDKAIFINTNSNTEESSDVTVKVIDVMVACQPLFGVRALNNDPSGKTSLILPLHQWLALVSILHLFKENKKNIYSIGINLIFEKYCNTCKRCKIDPVTLDEFNSVLGILETYSFTRKFSDKSKKFSMIELITSIPEIIPILRNNKAMCSLHEDLLHNLQ